MDEFQPWELRVFGETINSHYVSVGVAEKVEETTQIRWPALRVAANLTNTAGTLRKVAACLYADKVGMSYDDALGKIDGMSFDELAASVVLVDDDTPTGYVDGFPPVAAEDSTST